MDEFYFNPTYGAGNPRVYAPFTPYYLGRNWFSSTYERIHEDGKMAEGNPKPLASRLQRVTNFKDGTEHYAVSGSQARLLKPVVRHWSETAYETGEKLQDQKKIDEFYQELEKPFTISMIAENQMVMKNIVSGTSYSIDKSGNYSLASQTPVDIQYQAYWNGNGTGIGLTLHKPFANDVLLPEYDELYGGFVKGKTDTRVMDAGQEVTTGASYPIPVLSTLLPEGIVPVDRNGRPWPKDGSGWQNAELDFNVIVRNVSTIQSEEANRRVVSGANLPNNSNYQAQVTFVESAGRYMVRLVPNIRQMSQTTKDPLTDPQDHQDMKAVLAAPKLLWNQNLDMESEVTVGVQSDSYTEEGAPETNVMLRRWQQSRSFAGSWVDGFKFLTDDQSDQKDNQNSPVKGVNPFSVGQEYSGYYMDSRREGSTFTVFNDTRLDSTGPDGRIKDRTLLGDMERGSELDTTPVDIEDYSEANIRNQSDLVKTKSLTSAMTRKGLRKARNITWGTLDINGNGRAGTQDKLAGENTFVTNTMKIYVKNPNIMLDKRSSLTKEEKGAGDNSGWPDFKLRANPQKGAEDLDDYTEDPDHLMDKTSVKDPAGNGTDMGGIGYQTVLWYGVTVLNKPTDSPMHSEMDNSAPLSDAEKVRLDSATEYLKKEDGSHQNPGEASEDPSKQKKPDDGAVTAYEESLAVRRRKLSESGSVAHGAFVFSDYLPWIVGYLPGDNMEGIMLQTYQEDGSPGQLLTVQEAQTAGWTIRDDTPKGQTAGDQQFVSITVIPPESQNNPQDAFTDRQKAYESLAAGNRPAGYLGNGQKFTLKIRTKVVDAPNMTDPDDPDNPYMENGRSKEIFFNRAFVNLDMLDGNYGSLNAGRYYDDQNRSWFADQKKDSISYYNGTKEDKDQKPQKVNVRDSKKLPKDNFVDLKLKDYKPTNVIRRMAMNAMLSIRQQASGW